jgi:hypothetical protein
VSSRKALPDLLLVDGDPIANFAAMHYGGHRRMQRGRAKSPVWRALADLAGPELRRLRRYGIDSKGDEDHRNFRLPWGARLSRLRCCTAT